VWIAVESNGAFAMREIQLVLMAAERISSVEVGCKKSESLKSVKQSLSLYIKQKKLGR